jgi:hypothetical protein
MKSKKIIIAMAVLVVLGAMAGAGWYIVGQAGVAETHRRALPLLPEGTVGVVSIDVEALREHAFSELEPLLGFRLDDPDTRKELGAYFATHIGFDPFAVRRMVFFVIDDEPGMLLHGDFEFDPSVGRTREYEGHTLTHLGGGGLWATPLAGALAVGEEDALRPLIDVDRGARKGLAGTHAGAAHLEMLDALGNGFVLGTVVFNEEMNEELGRELVAGASIQAAGLRFGMRDGALLLKADAATRDALMKRLDTLEADARKGIDQAREHLEHLDLLPAIGVVVADRHMDAVFEMLTPTQTGDLLRLELDTQAASLLYVSAMLSTVAGFTIPMML